MIFNAHHEPSDATLSDTEWGELWVKELDTEIGRLEKEESFKAGNRITTEARCLVVLRHVP